MLAGRNIGLALSTATLMASWVTGNTTLLAPEFGYRNGLWGMFSYALAGLGLILFAPLALRIKQLMPSARTSGDFIRLRYGRLAWCVFMVITAIYTLGFLMTQAMGAGILLEALSGFDYRMGRVVVIGVSTLYTLFGGRTGIPESAEPRRAFTAQQQPPRAAQFAATSRPADRLEFRSFFDGRGVSQQHLVVKGVCFTAKRGFQSLCSWWPGLDDDPHRHRFHRSVGACHKP